jgi:quercetin dioxygenase-like cupin family protein
MNIQSIKAAFEDDRGSITDLVYKTDFDAVTLIKSNKGSIRGNHFHKDTTQYSYILSGSVIAYSQKPDDKVERKLLKPGELMISLPLERHALHAAEDSEILIITKGPRNGLNYEADTFRVNPLHLQFVQLISK